MKDININYEGLSFLERYKLAKQFKDKFYTEYFAKQIRYIDEELKGRDR